MQCTYAYHGAHVLTVLQKLLCLSVPKQDTRFEEHNLGCPQFPPNYTQHISYTIIPHNMQGICQRRVYGQFTYITQIRNYAPHALAEPQNGPCKHFVPQAA